MKSLQLLKIPYVFKSHTSLICYKCKIKKTSEKNIDKSLIQLRSKKFDFHIKKKENIKNKISEKNLKNLCFQFFPI